MLSSNNIVELSNVDFAYPGNNLLLKNINLTIPYGKVTAIMGGSGCGKTTLLRIITGKLCPVAGKVKLFDESIENSSLKSIYRLRQRIGMLFQFGALFTDMTVAENIAFPLRENTQLSISLINRIVAMKLEAVGLTGTQHLMPAELSGGMARRVALARSQALDPELMLYDEPFTGLDPISLNIIAMLIKELNTELNQTSILVTHDISSTMKIADYIYFMANGEIIASGTPKELHHNTNPMVDQFIKGQVEGPFAYRYPTKKEYHKYLYS